uniref:Uncharacterized protein n=1 Tax=Marseillevirus LCMAC101 TaxID=2506602 RepID=A0A481YTK9_9VIRU|nr:MAG: hypothetical protein LCMAC101_06900 [Marseillevirus LCMAC101]
MSFLYQKDQRGKGKEARGREKEARKGKANEEKKKDGRTRMLQLQRPRE